MAAFLSTRLDDWLALHGVEQSQLRQDDQGLYWSLEGHKHRVNWLKKHTSFHQQGMPKIHHKLLRSVIGKLTKPPRVFDACAGLGRDSFLLTLAGCEVLACERHPEVFALLMDAYRQAKQTGWIGQDLFSAVYGDALDYLSSWPKARPRPDVIYIDPMYPQKLKGQVKAEMAFLQQTVACVEEGEWLQLAKTTATMRVVVKRPLRGVYLNGQQPTFSFSGRTTRYDVYQLS
jgi:16S rRNA (guanine1516-N2)-methyltransferase